MSSMTVGIAGFTGKFARLLASSILEQSPNVKIRGLARDPTKGDAFEVEKIHPFVRGCDIVVCCYLGDDNLMIEGQKLLIKIVEEENVHRYVASDWSLDWTKLKTGELFAKEPCQRINAFLDQKQNVKGVHILVGGFTDVLFEPFFKIWDRDNGTFRYWGNGDEVWECTTYLNAAQYTAAICLDRDAIGVWRFAGDVISITGMANTFERVYGIKPKLEHLGALSELHDVMIDEREKYGDDFYKYVFHWYQYFTLSDRALMGPDYDNKRYPEIKPFTVEEFMKKFDVEQFGEAYFPWENKTRH